MIEKIFISVVALIMLVLTSRKDDRTTTLLTLGLTIGILISWTGLPIIIFSGLILYMFCALFIAILQLKNNKLSKLNKTTIVLAGIWAFGTHLFSIMHWPYAGEVKLSLIIPIVFYFISLTKGMIKRKELGYLTIMNIDFLLQLLR